MSEEEMQRKMEFIVNQQAQFVLDIQQLREAQSELTTKQSVLSDAMLSVIGIVGKLSEAQERTDEALAEMARAQAATDDRLSIFINVIERYISRNGGDGNAQEN